MKDAAWIYISEKHGLHLGDEMTSYGRLDRIVEEAFIAGAEWQRTQLTIPGVKSIEEFCKLPEAQKVAYFDAVYGKPGEEK